MNKAVDKYLNELNNYLSSLPQTDRQDVIEFYQELMLDGNFQNEAAIVKEFGTSKQLAYKIQADYSATDNFSDSKNAKETSRSNLKSIWLIILGVLAAPVGIPLAIATVAVMIAILIAFCAIFITFAATITLLFIGGIYIFVRTFGLLFSSNWATGIFYVGISIALISVGLLLFPLIIRFIRFLIAECAQFFRHIGRRVFKERYFKTSSTLSTEES